MTLKWNFVVELKCSSWKRNWRKHKKNLKLDDKQASLFLEQNLFKSISKGPAFLWQTHIQTIEYGLNDTISTH